MNKSESKYFNTALLMDEALYSLLEKKDLEYITVKEICQKAGVNRSTFYLHYESISDLVDEALDNVLKRFVSYFDMNKVDVVNDDLDDLIFISEDYLRPYLQFIYENKGIHRAAMCSPNGTQSDKQYKMLKEYVLEPVLSRFDVPENLHKYYISYYIQGINAVVTEWLNNNCEDDIDSIIKVIESCVRPPVKK